MHRQIVYVDENPLDTDFLNAQKHAMIALGMALQAILGTSTLVSGLGCTPTGPASLEVLVGPGSIMSVENVDNTAYGSLAADTTHQIVKQGIVLDTTTLNCPAPLTTGFSINYLVQVAYQDTDAGSEVLPYYDADNPEVAYAGPNNTGVSQNTIREGQCVVSVKAGVAATTGTQTTPAPDAGFTGLWVVTVNFGQTAINSGNISQVSGAPFIAETLTQKISEATGDARYAPIGSTKLKLGANATVYISPSGDDSAGDGSSGNPWKTRTKAYSYIQENVDLNGFSVTVQLADGTYTDAFAAGGECLGQSSPSQIIFNGNSGTPSNVVMSPSASNSGAFEASFGATYTVQNMKIANANGPGLTAGEGGAIYTGPGIVFGSNAGGAHVFAQGGLIQLLSNYTINGNAPTHAQASNPGGSVTLGSGIVVTLTGTPAFSNFVQASLLGMVGFQSSSAPTFSGGATGARYLANSNGVIATNGSSTSYFPGNSAGSTSTGGQYT